MQDCRIAGLQEGKAVGSFLILQFGNPAISDMTYDVAVVGAGPAGSWTARSLARRGARVLLLRPVASARKTLRRRNHGPRAGPRGRRRRRSPVAVRLHPLRALHVVRRRRAPAMCRSQRAPLSSRAAATSTDCCSTRPGARALDVVESRVTTVRAARGGFDIDTAAGTSSRGAARRRRRRQQPRQTTARRTVPAGSAVDRDRLLRARCDERRDPDRVRRRSARIYLVVSAARDISPSASARRRDAGVSAADLRQVAADWIARTGIADGARLEAYSWPIPSLPARRPRNPATGRPRLAARRRRRRPRRSDHARRHLLRAALGGVGRRGDRVERRGAVARLRRAGCARRSASSWRGRRGSRADSSSPHSRDW